MLEDMIQVGVNDVLKQIKAEKDKKLGKYTNGMGGIL
ncbi:MAG: YbaB/EbfC family nucleoid-associated protein [Clostridium sp.]|nr:MAG: YbaB/EbfC family nucleoid-associated protein [Clostridium sp.]